MIASHDRAQSTAALGTPGVERCADEIIARIQRGEPIDGKVLAADYPEHAERLAALLPAMRALAALSGSRDMRLPLEDPNSAAGEDRRLGDFRILREIGRGGMGIVYEAEQISLGRRVALKVLPFASILDSRQLTRFQNEARATATLQHPHIVPVYTVGTERGVHYLAMQLIDGISLAEALAADDGRVERRADTGAAARDTIRASLSRTKATDRQAWHRRVAQWGIEAAEALEHAHSVGIVHRDIKPGNLLIDQDGKLWVTDFGLARLPTDAGLTMTGDMLGTLRYMSPEQALAKRGLVDHRTDVYSLGITLYELLTGRAAFCGYEREELLRQIAWEDPWLPRRIDRTIPAELETIVLKAIANVPSDRYTTAQELADDLQRYLKLEPIRARRPGPLARAVRLAQRNRAISITVAVTAAILLLFGNIAAWWISRESQRAVIAGDVVAEHQYVTAINLAAERRGRHDLAKARELLATAPPSKRGFEWHYLSRAMNRRSMLPIPLTRYVVAAVSPDERLVVTLADGSVDVWQLKTGVHVAKLDAKSPYVDDCAFSPDGKRLALAHDIGIAQQWNTETWQCECTRQFLGPLIRVRYSPNGDWVAFAQRHYNDETGAQVSEDVVFLCDCSDWDKQRRLEGMADLPHDIAISGDGQLLAAGGADGFVYMWKAATGELVWKTDVSTVRTGGHAGARSVAFANRQPLLAVGTTDIGSEPANIVLLRLETGELAERFGGGFTTEVKRVRFSADDQTIVAASWDGCAALWSLGQDRKWHHVEVFSFDDRLRDLHLLSDGTLITSDNSGGVRQSNLSVPQDGLRIPLAGPRLERWLAAFRLKPDRMDRPLIDHVGKMSPVKSPRAFPAGVMVATVCEFSPEGRELALGTEAGQVLTLDCTNWTSTGLYDPNIGEIRAIAHSPDGQRMAVAGTGTRVLVVERPFERGVLSHGRADTQALAFAADGQSLYLARQLNIIDQASATLEELAVDATRSLPRQSLIDPGHDWPRMSQVTLQALLRRSSSFSPTDFPRVLKDRPRNLAAARQAPLIAAAFDNGVVQLYEGSDWRPTLTLTVGEMGTGKLAIDPSGRTVAAITGTGHVLLWSTSTGRTLLTLDPHLSAAYDLEFAPDGTQLVCVGRAFDGVGEIVVWEATPAETSGGGH